MYTRFFKRFLDLFISLLALIILLPFLIPIVLCLLLTGEHQVLYFQQRVGYNNSRFNIWKFATMLKDSPNLNTGSLTVRNDPRILPFGNFLRKSKINELPQIINVLIGNMSIVGPRPQMYEDFKKFSEELQDDIYNVKPGVTGLASIIFRDEEKWISECGEDPHQFYKNHIAPYKGELEIWYQNNISFSVDVKIIFATAWVIIFPNSDLIYRLLKRLPKKPGYLV